MAFAAVVDPQAAEFFNVQMDDAENGICCDGGRGEASWASIQHGIYLSIGAAGLHRSLGVKVSFVQSTTMDSWKPVHLKMMELGGNRRFNEFMATQGIPMDTPIREKYSTRAARWYRENLKAIAEGSEALSPLPEGTGHLPANDIATSELQHVLDRVFAESPRDGSMTLGGVSDDQLSQEAPKSIAGTLCQKLSTCFKQACRSEAKATELESTELSDSQELLPPVPLPMLLGSNRCTTAARLQKESSGKMQGFGSKDCPQKLVAAAIADA